MTAGVGQKASKQTLQSIMQLSRTIDELEKEIESYGIELGDETFMSMMNKHRGDVYGYDVDNEGDDELEMDM